MKHLLYLLLTITLFSSCSKDDNDTDEIQEYTSFSFITNEDIVFKNSVVGYYTKDGLCKKIADLGDLKRGIVSDKYRIMIDTLSYIYFFSDYPHPSIKLDVAYILKKNTQNSFEIAKGTKGIPVDNSNPMEYPQP